MAHNKDKLIIADNLAKTYAIDIKTGKILWTKKNLASFNSQIKIIKNKFFISDINNTSNTRIEGLSARSGYKD